MLLAGRSGVSVDGVGGVGVDAGLRGSRLLVLRWRRSQMGRILWRLSGKPLVRFLRVYAVCDACVEVCRRLIVMAG